MATVKKGMITMSKGNTKLASTILIWSLPAVLTCPNCNDCKSSCYARKAERIYPQVLPCRTKNWQASKNSSFVEDMIFLISRTWKKARKPMQAVRIHESGDFYNQAYVDAWVKIARKLPDVPFYGYSKAWDHVDLTELNSLPNVNIVRSVTPDNRINFGTLQDMKAMCKEYKGKLCPYGLAKKLPACGTECKHCLNQEYVFFIKH